MLTLKVCNTLTTSGITCSKVRNNNTCVQSLILVQSDSTGLTGTNSVNGFLQSLIRTRLGVIGFIHQLDRILSPGVCANQQRRCH